MSRVQPPGWPLPFGTPTGAKTPGAGHVVSDGVMKSSMRNGALVKWLSKGTPFAFVPLQTLDRGGVVRLTSFCSKQEYTAPAWLSWMVLPDGPFASPLTPYQPP